MTEKQVLDLQQTSQRLYLLMVGSFYHAYNEAAFALSRITGYKILPKQRKQGTIYQLGFGVKQIDSIKQRCAEHGIELKMEDDKGLLWSFTGGDTSFDASLVSQPESKSDTNPATMKVSHSRRHSFSDSIRKHEKKLALIKLLDVDLPHIYCKAVQLQNFSLRLLSPEREIARKYRFTAIDDLLKMSTHLIENADLLTLEYGKERMDRAKHVAVLARTYATTIGNLVNLRVLTPVEEADAAVIIAELEGEAKAIWWECYNKEKKKGQNSKEEYPPTECAV